MRRGILSSLRSSGIGLAVLFWGGIVVDPAGAQLTTLLVHDVLTGIDEPTDLTHAGDERLFLAFRDGRIVIVDDGVLADTPFLDLRAQVHFQDDKGGLYNLVFHPEFPSPPYLFVLYVNKVGETVVTRFVIPAGAARPDPASEVRLLTIEDRAMGEHDGNDLAFGPDGLLYVSTGDSGSGFDPRCFAQENDSLEGKVLRLDVDVAEAPYFAVPPGNPFVGEGPEASLIWAKGLRNPWRISFDSLTGDLYIPDLGERTREEVNFQPAGSPGGANYGYKVLEGTLCRGGTSGCHPVPPACDSTLYTPPVIEYGHDHGRCAVIGGYVYRGARMPEVEGAYLYADFCTGEVFAAREEAGVWTVEETGAAIERPRSFAEDLEGELYALTTSSVVRLDSAILASGVLELTADSLEADEAAGSVFLTVERRGGQLGPATVEVSTSPASATGNDFQELTRTLSWGPEEGGERGLEIPIFDDDLAEGEESFEVVLSGATGASLGSRSVAVVTIADDDACIRDDHTLCLNQQRFEVDVEWKTRAAAGSGKAVELTPDAGYFWFFNPENPEIVVKVLRVCEPPWNSFWLFAAGLTDVETKITVTDRVSGESRVYAKALGPGFEPIRDTRAFLTCP